MINVNKLTSTLAKLSDLQLQTYAKMNPDPYTIALAVAESNRRKELRAAGQGAQGMQEMPKVVDQAVAEMAPQQLPEDMGIARIPAGDMNFAGGGIIAFADGGGVERYNGTAGSLTGEVQRILQKSPYDRTPQDNALLEQAGYSLQRRTLSPDSGVAGVNTYLEGIGPNIRNYFTAGTSQLSDEELAQQPSVGGAQNERILRGLGISPSVPKAASAAPTQAAPAASNAAMIAKASASPYVSTDAKSAEEAALLGRYPTNKPKAGDAAPKVDTTQRGTGAIGAAASLPSLTDLAKLRQSIYDKQDFKDPAAAQLKELEARERASAEEGLAALKRDQSKFEDAFKGREARLTAREGDIGKQKDTNTGLAFLNAGLAIMSTPGGLATAIGKGAQVGTAQYAAGLDKIRSAQERLDDARDKMEELKLNRAEMSAKEIRAAEKDIRNTGVDAQKRAIDGIRMAADVNEKRATDIFGKSVELSKTVYEQQQQNARSAAQIAATKDTPERVVWNQLLAANNGDAVKATAEFQKIKSEKFNVLQSYADYLKGFAGKETITPPMAFDQYAAQFSVPTVKAPGKGATVLKQP